VHCGIYYLQDDGKVGRSTQLALALQITVVSGSNIEAAEGHDLRRDTADVGLRRWKWSHDVRGHDGRGELAAPPSGSDVTTVAAGIHEAAAV